MSQGIAGGDSDTKRTRGETVIKVLCRTGDRGGAVTIARGWILFSSTETFDDIVDDEYRGDDP